jgi:hypothetical protein
VNARYADIDPGPIASGVREPDHSTSSPFSCSTFDVYDNSEFSWHGTRHFDSDGNLLRIVEQISGVDTLYDPLNGKSVSGTYYNSETLDFANVT